MQTYTKGFITNILCVLQNFLIWHGTLMSTAEHLAIEDACAILRNNLDILSTTEVPQDGK